MKRTVKEIIDAAGDIGKNQVWFQRHEIKRLAEQIVALEKELDEHNPIYDDHRGLDD